MVLFEHDLFIHTADFQLDSFKPDPCFSLHTDSPLLSELYAYCMMYPLSRRPCLCFQLHAQKKSCTLSLRKLSHCPSSCHLSALFFVSENCRLALVTPHGSPFPIDGISPAIDFCPLPLHKICHDCGHDSDQNIMTSLGSWRCQPY